MRRYLLAALLVASMSSVPMIAGCDRTIHETEKTTVGPNGEKSTSQEKTVQHNDGTVTTEKEVKHTNPNAVP